MHYGNGWTHSDVYSLPVYLRRFYMDLLGDAKKVENDNIQKRNEDIKRRSQKMKSRRRK